MSADWQVTRLRMQMLIARARWAVRHRRRLPHAALLAYSRAIAKAEIAIAIIDARDVAKPNGAERPDKPRDRA
jgi:hypothetical protein